VTDEAAIYGLLVVVGAPTVVITAAEGGTFGGGATVSLMMLLLGMVGLGRVLVQRVVEPRARTVRESRRESI